MLIFNSLITFSLKWSNGGFERIPSSFYDWVKTFFPAKPFILVFSFICTSILI